MDGYAERARAATSLLKEHLASLPEDLLDDPSADLRSLLPHGQMQALIFAAQRIAPHLSRDAFDAGFTAGDLVHWLDIVDDAVASNARPPRGTYQSPSTFLAPIMPMDLEALYLASLHPPLNHRWRLRGRTPSLQEFHDLLYDPSVLAQYMVHAVDGGPPVGLVSGYEANLVAGHCCVAIHRLLDKDRRHAGLMIEGMLVFVQYLFDHFDLRKVYFEVPEYNTTLLSNGPSSLLEQEGRFVDHLYFGDRHWDLYRYSLHRSRWEGVADRFRGRWPDDHFRDGDR